MREEAVFELSAGTAGQLPESNLPEVVFAGRSNVGKSSLINTLLQRRALARTSATPGKTATINFYRMPSRRLVDLPGYGYAKVSLAEKRRFSELIDGYFRQDRDLRLVVQLVDMRHAPSADDRRMMEFMAEQEIPFVVVLTKSDKLNKTERAARLQALSDDLSDFEGLTVIPFSSQTGEGREALWDIITEITKED